MILPDKESNWTPTTSHHTRLTHWGRGKMAGVSQTTLSNIFFFDEKVIISIKISLKFVPKGTIDNIPALVQMMAWRRSGDKPLSEAMLVSLLTHIYITRPQWVYIKSKLISFPLISEVTSIFSCNNSEPYYSDVMMVAIASQITSFTIVHSNVYSDANQRKHQSSASLAFVRGIHRGPVNFPHKWHVTREMFPFDEFIMTNATKQGNINTCKHFRPNKTD